MRRTPDERQRERLTAARVDALATLELCKIHPDEQFHTLSRAQVDALIVEADKARYRQPRNANGSRARYFHARLLRAVRAGQDR